MPYFRWVAERGAEVADALEAAHRDGIVHRDIKPPNILVAGPERWKLTDFGIARLQFEEPMTGTSIQTGTLPYSSPEQIDRTDKEIDARTDVYSLGATLFECLTLRPPIHGLTTGAMLDRIRHGRRYPEDRITHHHAEDDHDAFLERPFLEALEAVRARMER